MQDSKYQKNFGFELEIRIRHPALDKNVTCIKQVDTHTKSYNLFTTILKYAIEIINDQIETKFIGKLFSVMISMHDATACQ